MMLPLNENQQAALNKQIREQNELGIALMLLKQAMVTGKDCNVPAETLAKLGVV